MTDGALEESTVLDVHASRREACPEPAANAVSKGSFMNGFIWPAPSIPATEDPTQLVQDSSEYLLGPRPLRVQGMEEIRKKPQSIRSCADKIEERARIVSENIMRATRVLGEKTEAICAALRSDGDASRV